MLWIIPLLTTIVSLYFSIIITRKYLNDRRLYHLLYAVSLSFFTLASFAEFYSTAFSWVVWLYKLYYFPAISLVAVMAAATMYARRSASISHLFLTYVVVTSLALVYTLIGAQVDTQLLLEAKETVGGEAMPPEVRKFSFLLSGIGGIVLIGSSLWSWWRTKYDAFLYILGSSLVMSAGGSFSKWGYTSLLLISELLGIVLLYYGVIRLSAKRNMK